MLGVSGRATAKLHVTKEHRRRSDGMRRKTSTLPGEISLVPERATRERSEKSAEAVVAIAEAGQERKLRRARKTLAA